jgi:hypothetical protein
VQARESDLPPGNPRPDMAAICYIATRPDTVVSKKVQDLQVMVIHV